MGLWLDSNGILGAIPFIDIQIFSFLSLIAMQHAFLLVSFCHRKQSFLYDFPVNIQVILFMVFDFHASAFLRSGIYSACTTIQNYFWWIYHQLAFNWKKNREGADLTVTLCWWKGLSYLNSFLVFHSDKQLFSIMYMNKLIFFLQILRIFSLQ